MKWLNMTKRKTAKIDHTVTFFAADTISNVVTKEKEKYQFETDVSNIIVKLVDAGETVQYDFFTLPLGQKITLEDYLRKKMKENKKYLVRQKKEIWHSPDTGETLTMLKVEDNINRELFMILMNKDKT